jgi:hypothetical protein
MTMRSAPRPVSTPPTEVARRNPPRVVTSSCSGDRAEARRVGNRARYQDAIMTARQSRANLSESSWPEVTLTIALAGSWPSSQAGSAIEAASDFRWRGGILMMRRRMRRSLQSYDHPDRGQGVRDQLIDAGLSRVTRYKPDGDKIMRLHSRMASSTCWKPPIGSPTIFKTAQALAWTKIRPPGSGWLEYYRGLASEGQPRRNA